MPESIQEKVEQLKGQVVQSLLNLRINMEKAGINSANAYMAAECLAPLAAGFSGGDWMAAGAVLNFLLSGVPTNILSNYVQKWIDAPDTAKKIQAEMQFNAELRLEMKTILEKMGIVQSMLEELTGQDRSWFKEALVRDERQYHFSINIEEIKKWSGDFNIEKVDHLTVYIAEKSIKNNHLTNTDFNQVRNIYLEYIVKTHIYMSLRGIGLAENVPLKLALLDVYVPLKARLQLPEGDTWMRQRLAGRQLQDEEKKHLKMSESQPVLELIKENSGLVLLGDPGAGKTTFL